MNKGKMLSCATLLILGFAGASIAQDESGGRMNRQQGASDTMGRSSSDPDASFSDENPTPNDKIGDHPSSGDDKRGYDSDDAH